MHLQRGEVERRAGAKVLHALDAVDEAQWLAGRREGLGGSDAAAILGISPWASSWTLWQDKTSTEPPVNQDRRAFRAGHHLEPWILAEMMREEPALRVFRAAFQLQAADRPWQMVNLDGLADSTERNGFGGAEAKHVHPQMHRHWSDGPPAYYEAQVVHAFAVCPGLEWFALGAYFGGDDLRVYWFDRDDDLVAEVTAREAEWWQRHVVEGIRPDPDSHAATTAALSAFDANPGEVLTVEGPTLDLVEGLMASIVAAENRIKADGEIIDQAKNELRLLMGTATVLDDVTGRKWATWNPTAGSVAWKDMALANVPDAETVAENYRTPGRTLRIDAGRKNLKDTK